MIDGAWNSAYVFNYILIHLPELYFLCNPPTSYKCHGLQQITAAVAARRLDAAATFVWPETRFNAVNYEKSPFAVCSRAEISNTFARCRTGLSTLQSPRKKTTASGVSWAGEAEAGVG